MKALRAFLYVLVFVIGVGVGGAAIYFYPQLLGLSKTEAQTQANTDQIISEVGKLIELPTDERPTVATVSDAEKLKAQPFFSKAKNGDTVLIYTNSKRAILYRADENRIIEVGAVNINQATPSAEASPTPSPISSPIPSTSPEPVL